MKVLNWISYTLVIIANIALATSTYKAAIVEYASKTSAETFQHIILENVNEYLKYIEEAASEGADIIIFPENGLTEMDINEKNIEAFSTEVPDPTSSLSPCNLNNSTFSKHLIDLSCAAETHSIYVVINLVERCNYSSNIIYYNTNVVFDRKGVIIARYRKINLYKEKYVHAGNQTVSFKTDFGVTFGIFTCKDILYKNPSLNVLEDLEVTDIVFPTAWFSELPFLTALSTQHGYAVANRVNLLAANLDDPTFKKGGSGVYFGSGKMSNIYIAGAKTSKMLISTIPKIKRSNSSDNCLTVDEPAVENKANLMWGTFPEMIDFNTYKEDMSNYTFKELNLNQTNASETVCSGNSFCCSINISWSISSVPNYAYKLVAFNGGRQFGWEDAGVSVCGLIACLNESNSSCGLRHSNAPQGVTFDNILLNESFSISTNIHVRPATVNYDLKPLEDYKFCKQTSNQRMEVTLSSEKQKSLLTFALFGRVFDNDFKGTGVFNSGVFHLLNPYVVLTISIVVFLLQDH
ncbi:hypothetical protein FQA39_LY04682 [Lamprigera yunnana]|nr:hypothetical protein FQA39_LY04682 [Lamprigera yunnana]